MPLDSPPRRDTLATDRGDSLHRIAPLALLLLAGCATVRVDGGGGRTMTYLGLVRVVIPDRRGDVAAVDVQALGAGWDRGPFIGWKAGNWVSADPAKCQLLVVIRSPAQAENAAQVLRALEGQNACVADYTRSLRR